MDKLQEILKSQIEILSEKKEADGDVMNVVVNWAKSGEKTKNGRIYGEKILKREIGRLQASVEKGALIGTADHSLDGFSNIKNASHVITELCMDEEGLCWAEMRILPTDAGKNIMTLIKNKAEIGISSRGMGSVDEKTGEVKNDFKLLGIDIVANPSYSGGTLSLDNISESLDFEKKNPPSEELIKFVLDGVYDQRKEIGHEESYEQFLAEHGTAIRASILAEHSGISVEQQLIEMGEEGVLRKMKSEEKVKVWTADELYWEARTCGISPDDFAKKLNENEARKKADRDSGLNKKEIGSLIDEAVRAGVDTSNIEERKKYFEFAKTQATSELTIHEQALHIQKRMLAEGKKEEVGFIENILRHDAKEAEIQEKRMAVKGMVESEIIASGAFVSKEETHRHVNRELRKRGLKILDEDGQ